MKIGDKVTIKEDSTDKLPYEVPENTEFEIVGIIDEKVAYPYVLSSETFGSDWVQFFNEEEIIQL